MSQATQSSASKWNIKNFSWGMRHHSPEARIPNNGLYFLSRQSFALLLWIFFATANILFEELRSLKN